MVCPDSRLLIGVVAADGRGPAGDHGALLHPEAVLAGGGAVRCGRPGPVCALQR